MTSETPTEQTLTVQLNTAALMRRLSRAVSAQQRAIGLSLLPAAVRAARELDKTMARLNFVMSAPHRQANTVVHVAGLCARYQVRAGLDPLYTSHGNIDLLVQAILRGDDPEAEGLELLTPANRRLVAVAAMRGWSESHGWATSQGAMHRLWGTTRVEVRCG